MNKRVILGVLISFITVLLFPEEFDIEIFKLFDTVIESDSKTLLQTQLPDGAVYELFDCASCDRAVKINLYSSLGKTEYICLRIKENGIWFFKKIATFYNEPYNPKGAEYEISFFKYDSKCYKYMNQKFSDEKDLSSSIAVVDFKNAKSLINLIEEEIYTK